MKVALVLVSTLAVLPAFITPESFSAPPASTHVSSLTGSQAARADDVAEGLNGTYLCEGMRPDGRAYHGTVRIVRHNGAYQLLWSVGSEEQYLGIGILNGDVLAVSYFGGAPGVVAYRIERNTEKGPRLVGHWTVANANGQVFGETLTRLTHEVTAPPPMPERRQQRQPLTRIKPA